MFVSSEDALNLSLLTKPDFTEDSTGVLSLSVWLRKVCPTVDWWMSKLEMTLYPFPDQILLIYSSDFDFQWNNFHLKHQMTLSFQILTVIEAIQLH